jgi:hypothetical protein
MATTAQLAAGGVTSGAVERLAAQLRAQYNTGQGGSGSWDDAGHDRAMELAQLLVLNGVTDLSGGMRFVDTPGREYTPEDYAQLEAQIQSAGSEGGGSAQHELDAMRARGREPSQRQLQIGDKTVGYLGDYNNDGTYGSKRSEYFQPQDQNLLAWSARGHGNTSYSVVAHPDTGELFIVPGWASSSDAADVRRAAIFAGGVALAAVGGSGLAASSMGATGATGAALNGAAMGAGMNMATTQELSGDTLKAAALGGAGGALTHGLSGASGATGAAGATDTPLNMATIESGLGTPGYGYSAAAANYVSPAGVAFNPADIGSRANLMFGPDGTTVVNPNTLGAGGTRADHGGYERAGDPAADAVQNNPQGGSDPAFDNFEVGPTPTATPTATPTQQVVGPTTDVPTTPARPLTGHSDAYGDPVPGPTTTTTPSNDWLQLSGSDIANIARVGVVGLALANSDDGGTTTGPTTGPTTGGDGTTGDPVAMANDMLAFNKSLWEENRPFVQGAQERMLTLADGQIAGQTLQNTASQEYLDHWRTNFRPLEEQIVADARAYDTPERRQAAADSAMAEINSGFAKTGAARARQLAAQGVNPGSARSQAALAGLDVEQASAMASGAYGARRGVEQTGYTRRMDAAGLGRNLPAASASATNAASGAANSGINAANTSATVGTTGLGEMNNASQIASNNILGQGRLNLGYHEANTRSSDSRNSSNNQLWGALGSAVGAWAASSEELKTPGEPIDPNQALQEIVNTPVKDGWRYDPAKMAAKGIPMDDGRQHAGPMAEDVQATMGNEIAPGGEKIDLVSLNGKTMAAIQALDQKINTLAGMLRGGKLQAGAQA